MTNKNLLVKSFLIQKRVIFALLMRESITRFGRGNISFLWFFVEPMIFTLLFTFIWYMRNFDNSFKLPIVTFIVTGYGSLLIWRNAIGRSINSISSNESLLYHKNVTVLDVVFARIILEFIGSIASFIFLISFFYWFDFLTQPRNLLLVIEGIFFLVWFATGMSFIMAALSEKYEVIKQFWSAISLLLMMISGTFFMVDWLPVAAQKIVLLFPMVHCVEMIREGFMGIYIHAHYSFSYLFISNLCLTFIGLILLKSVKSKTF